MNESSDDRTRRDVDEEFQHHVDLQVERYLREGLDPAEARARAEARFGARDSHRATVVRLERAIGRRARAAAAARAIGRDVRSAARALVRRPAFTAAAVATIALAIGVATSLLTLANELVLRPVPGLARDGLVKVYIVRNGVLDGFAGHPHPAFLEYARLTRAFDALGAFAGRGFSVATGGRPSLVPGLLASGSLFDTLGTRPHVGRLLQPADDRPGGPPVAVVSHAFWLDQLGGDPTAVGRRLQINGQAYDLVGVAEPGFRGPFIGFPSDIFVPLHRASELAPDLSLDAWSDDPLELIGRLASGASPAAAQDELDRLAAGLALDHPRAFEGRALSVRAWTGLDADLERPVLGFVGVLGAIALLIAGVACVNVAGLMLHRGQARRGEFAVRQALGAARGAIARQLGIETLMLFLAGQTAGVLVAASATRWLHAFLPEFAIPIQLSLAVDWRVLLVVTGLTLGTALVFGLAPALAAGRVDPARTLRPTSADAPRQVRLRRALVATQFGATFVLLVTAGLFARALDDASARESGVRSAGIGAASVDVRVLSREEPAGRAYFDEWLRRVSAAPGVERAALARTLPLALGTTATDIEVEGEDRPPGGHPLVGNAVTPDYFATLGIALVSGRGFDAGDNAGTDAVAILSRSAAARIFGAADPIGRVLIEDARRLRVVGVAEDVAVSRPGDLDVPHYYVPFAQRYSARMWLVARGAGAPPLQVIADAAAAVDGALPVLRLESLDDRATERLFAERMAASVAGALGAVGVLLASVGLYGVVAFQAGQRRRELAVRLALGADRRRVRRMVLADGLRQVVVGLAGGIVAALLLTAGLRALAPGIGTWDPATFAAALVGLAVAALVAADLPARRAAAIDPMKTLRLE